MLALESLERWWSCGVVVELWVVTLVLVLEEEEREKVRLALVETVRWDCADMPEAERWRTRVLWGFLEWERARCGTVCGAVDCVVGGGVWPGGVKKVERWFGAGDGDMDLLGVDSISGLVGGVEPFVRALSDMSSSDLGKEPVEEADMG